LTVNSLLFNKGFEYAYKQITQLLPVNKVGLLGYYITCLDVYMA